MWISQKQRLVVWETLKNRRVRWKEQINHNGLIWKFEKLAMKKKLKNMIWFENIKHDLPLIQNLFARIWNHKETKSIDEK